MKIVSVLFAASCGLLTAPALAQAPRPAAVLASITNCRGYLDGGRQEPAVELAPGLRATYRELAASGNVTRMCLIIASPEAASLADAHVELWPGPLVSRLAGQPLPGFVDRKSYCTVEQPYDVVVVSTRADGSKSVGVSRVKNGESCPAASRGS